VIVHRCLFFRAHLAKDSIATRAFYRTVLMKGFHWYVQLMVTPNVQDTQCGFKLFTRRAAKSLFGSLHLYRWAFDTELIYLAERLHIPIAEVDMVPVRCTSDQRHFATVGIICTCCGACLTVVLTVFVFIGGGELARGGRLEANQEQTGRCHD
jgi:hypothetical protein